MFGKFHSLIVLKFYATCEKVGVEVDGFYIKNIILPVEMREIFNQVIEASKRAEVNNIKRREEIRTLNVYGGLDGVMNGLVDLKGDVRV